MFRSSLAVDDKSVFSLLYLSGFPAGGNVKKRSGPKPYKGCQRHKKNGEEPACFQKMRLNDPIELEIGGKSYKLSMGINTLQAAIKICITPKGDHLTAFQVNELPGWLT
ncbi:MAG: hypothetical protein HQL95_01545 [Magnetococcales bacterium]|nr:hypothetical protein [Magnetococcales bacterium]